MVDSFWPPLRCCKRHDWDIRMWYDSLEELRVYSYPLLLTGITEVLWFQCQEQRNNPSPIFFQTVLNIKKSEKYEYIYTLKSVITEPTKQFNTISKAIYFTCEQITLTENRKLKTLPFMCKRPLFQCLS